MRCGDIGHETEPAGGICVSDQAIRLKRFTELAHVLCQLDRDTALDHLRMGRWNPSIPNPIGPSGDRCLTLQTGNFYFGTSGYYSSGTDTPLPPAGDCPTRAIREDRPGRGNRRTLDRPIRPDLAMARSESP